MPISLQTSDLEQAALWLAERDEGLARVLRRYGYPPLWEREQGFPALVYIILEQQVSLASARAAFNRLKEHVSTITPDNLLQISDEDMFRIGFSRQKKQYARLLAEAVLDGRFDFHLLPGLSETALRDYMKNMKGIGDWTVDCYALMCLLHPDVLPKGDVALYQAYKELYQLDFRPGFEYLWENTQHWRPWRSVGARMLWHFYLCERAK